MRSAKQLAERKSFGYTSLSPVNQARGIRDQHCEKTEASGKAFSSLFLGYHRHSWKGMAAGLKVCPSACEENL